jgi:hypothetical protein
MAVAPGCEMSWPQPTGGPMALRRHAWSNVLGQEVRIFRTWRRCVCPAVKPRGMSFGRFRGQVLAGSMVSNSTRERDGTPPDSNIADLPPIAWSHCH